MSRPTLIRLIVIVAILIIWEAVRQLNLVGPLLLASPSEIAVAFAKSWPQFFAAFQGTDQAFLRNTRDTHARVN